VLGEDPVHELAAAGDADLLEECLDVVADGVRREVQLGGDLGGAEPRAMARVTSRSRPLRP